ncbi:MAG: DUF3109 family protein [Prevotellaceae bacterium]|jgi:hypothetical protein|nr:DUF3109 family protein [Prevotellaceae bacterium]
MVEIGNTIVSFELFEQMFCCDLQQCKGCCCVEGDAGAPLAKSEIEKINEILPKLLDFLTPKAKEVIERQGISYIDLQGEDVTSLVDGKECVFAYFENEICLCALEKACNKHITDFPKPISCHLYPVIIDQYDDFVAVNIHHHTLCRSAEICGKTNKIHLYKFLKKPLIRRFGTHWYAELKRAAEAYYQEFG